MKKIYSILFFFCLTAVVWGQELLNQANQSYSREDYKKAAELYEKALQDEGISSDLYYNLGNAYYKDKQYAKAILNYERALLLSPGNEDARFNLNMANSHITDKIEPVGSFFLTVWIHSLINTLSSNSWAILGIISFLLFIVGIAWFLYKKCIIAENRIFCRIIIVIGFHIFK